MRRGLLVCAVVALAGESRAAGTSRSRFEPTDLELERPGTTEVDLQTGVLYGDGSAGLRLAVVDFELDLGLLPNVELDVDGAFSLNNLETPTPAFAGEALWTSVKLGPGMVASIRSTDQVRHRAGPKGVKVLVIWAPGGEIARVAARWKTP